MKKIPLALVVFYLMTAITSCKKSSGSSQPKETVLSQALSNGNLWLQFEYNDKKQLSKLTEYDLATGKPDYSQAFQYDAKGRLDMILDYNSDGKFSGREEYSKDLAGNFTQVEFFDVASDPKKVVTRVMYTYKEGYIVKEAWIDLNTGKEVSYRKYVWYLNGNLRSSEYYGDLDPLTLSYKAEYSPIGNPLPETIAKHSGYPINFWNYYFVAEEIHNTYSAAFGGPVDYKEVMSQRKYNAEGLLTEQTITNKHTVPADADEVSQMTYVYIQI